VASPLYGMAPTMPRSLAAVDYYKRVVQNPQHDSSEG
jgi:hypothetical protein